MECIVQHAATNRLDLLVALAWALALFASVLLVVGFFYLAHKDAFAIEVSKVNREKEVRAAEKKYWEDRAASEIVRADKKEEVRAAVPKVDPASGSYAINDDAGGASVSGHVMTIK